MVVAAADALDGIYAGLHEVYRSAVARSLDRLLHRLYGRLLSAVIVVDSVRLVEPYRLRGTKLAVLVAVEQHVGELVARAILGNSFRAND